MTGEKEPKKVQARGVTPQVPEFPKFIQHPTDTKGEGRLESQTWAGSEAGIVGADLGVIAILPSSPAQRERERWPRDGKQETFDTLFISKQKPLLRRALERGAMTRCND